MFNRSGDEAVRKASTYTCGNELPSSKHPPSFTGHLPFCLQDSVLAATTLFAYSNAPNLIDTQTPIPGIVDKDAGVGDSLESASSLEPLSSGSHQLVYSPATKLTGWLEGYASHLELNVWMTTITKTEWSDDARTWIVEINRKAKATRVLEVKHLVFATGFGDRPTMLDLAGKSDFKGEVVHSSQFTSAENYIRKKAVVIGACNFAPLAAETTEKATLDGLAKARLKTNLGPFGVGIIPLRYDRAGGYYMDKLRFPHRGLRPLYAL
ncbi:hypothetical protein PAXINDRAFT_18399 [Paxillus involutus ATCC 200175]|uniref:L-ornithine N(5)-oxygenase n=1 Tax=Paxillus involutus ATCC 200175 TaxID=664439 RepID=A0A0C9SZ00_PAXIN|nr:hypothetical protein PAXINDRAFT_18399 [Paxillus involutus ATCC 200175]